MIIVCPKCDKISAFVPDILDHVVYKECASCNKPSEFISFLDKTSKEVDAWPEWKKKALLKDYLNKGEKENE